MHTFAHAHKHRRKWKYNIHASMTFRLKLSGKWSVCVGVMLSVKDTVEFGQPATLALNPPPTTTTTNPTFLLSFFTLLSLFSPTGLSG